MEKRTRLNHAGKRGKRKLKIVLLALAILAGVVLYAAGVLDGPVLMGQAVRFAQYWWFPLVLVVLQGLMFAVAWPGSVLYWAAGALYEPMVATVIIVLGGTGGALFAYAIARNMKHGEEHAIASSKHFAFLERHAGFAELCALRTLPNFPHAVVNYGAGILNVPLTTFIASTLIGFTAKGFLYARAIYGMVNGESGALAGQTMLPLAALALLFMAGAALRKKACADKVAK